MIITEGGGCLRRGPGFWFGPRPHTLAQRVWSTRAALWTQDSDSTHSAYAVVSGLVSRAHAAERPGKRSTNVRKAVLARHT
jgi:hypothetical protein